MKKKVYKNCDQNKTRNGKNGQIKTYVSVLPALFLGAVALPLPAIVAIAVVGALAVIAIAVIVGMRARKKSAKAAPPVEERVVEAAPAEDIEKESPSEEPAREERVVKEECESADTASEAAEETSEAEESDVNDLVGFEETSDAGGRAYDAKRRVFVLVRYDRSYVAKLIQSDDKTKSYYDEIKSELLSFKGVKSRISWRHENFRIGRERVAKLQFRGKKLCLYLPLDPNDYADSKYKIDDLSDIAKNEDVPLAYVIKNDLRARYAKELIATAMERFDAQKTGDAVEEFSKEYPFDTLESLIERKLIKVLMSEKQYEEAAADRAPASPISPAEVVKEVRAESVKNMLSNERATSLIEEGVRYCDRTRTGVVNIDQLNRHFKAGERVTLEEMKKRIKGFDKRMTYVKVLARGILDKPLIVEGDDFSIDAAKMILLTGGKVIRTKRK